MFEFCFLIGCCYRSFWSCFQFASVLYACNKIKNCCQGTGQKISDCCSGIKQKIINCYESVNPSVEEGRDDSQAATSVNVILAESSPALQEDTAFPELYRSTSLSGTNNTDSEW